MKKGFIALTIIVIIIGVQQWLTRPMSEELVLPVSSPQSPLVKVDNLKLAQSDKQITTAVKKPLNIPSVAPTKGYIIQCGRDQLQTTQDIAQQYFTELSQSNDEKKRLVYALYSDLSKEQSRLDLIEKYLSNFSPSPLIMMDVVTQCALNSAHNICDDDLIEKAIQSDPDNGAMWLNVASYYASKNQHDNTLNALKELVKSPLYNGYEFAGVQLFIDASNGSSHNDFSARAITALGLMAAKSIAINPIFDYCTTNIVNDSKKAQACLTMAGHIERNAKSALTTLIGNGIQQKIYNAEGNISAEKQKKENSKALRYSFDDHSYKAIDLSMIDESLFRHWIENIQEFGETKASDMLVKEAEELSKNQYYNPCPNK